MFFTHKALGDAIQLEDGPTFSIEDMPRHSRVCFTVGNYGVKAARKGGHRIDYEIVPLRAVPTEAESTSNELQMGTATKGGS